MGNLGTRWNSYKDLGMGSCEKDGKYDMETEKKSWAKFFFFFVGPYPRCMAVPSLGVESELRLLANATAIATQDP